MKFNDAWGWDVDNSGIFSVMEDAITEAPEWLTDTDILDMLYHEEHSAEKLAAPIVDRKALSNTDNRLTSVQRISLVKMLYLKYGKTWDRLWRLYNIEYDPIENYSMTEKETPNITKTHKGDITRGVSEDFKTTETIGTDTDMLVSTEDETDRATFGYNSSTPVPSGLDEITSSTRTSGEADKNKSTREVTQDGTTNEGHDFTDTETGTRQLERSGNIGVTTSQQMAESEIALWKWNFYDSIMRDIDSMLTLSIY